MKIQQSDQFKYSSDFKNFYYLGKDFGPGIGFLSNFLHSDFRIIKKNLEADIKELFIDSKIVTFYETTIINDTENDQIYIGFEPDFQDEEIDETYEKSIENKSELELFQSEVWGSMHLSQNNFFHILRNWNTCLLKKEPFILLYQDENNWFDLISFSSQSSMELFMTAHI